MTYVKLNQELTSVNLKLYSFIFGINILLVVSIQLILKVLKLLKFSEYLIRYGKEFQSFGRRYLKLFVSNLTWIGFGISRFVLLLLSCWTVRYWQSESFLYRTGFILLIVLKISIHELRALIVIFPDNCDNSSYKLKTMVV